ncbi:MAG: hypothetical protein HY905_20690 [Deltaproteobacteria bacterium]|nr:hypothetical protein [Deltaproteobacteria bacterium]
MHAELSGPLVAFVLGAAVGAAPFLLGLLPRARRGARPDESAASSDRSGRRTVRVAAVSAAITLAVLAAGGYAALRMFLGSTPMAAADPAQAVDEFRRTVGASCPAVPRSIGLLGPPCGGVYEYEASGSWTTTAPILGAEHRELPATVPATVLADDDGWSLALRYFDKHVTTLRFRGGVGPHLEELGGETDSVRFGLPVHTDVTCDPPDVVAPAPLGTEWTAACEAVTGGLMGASQTLLSTDTLVGVERLDVGGTPLEAWHVHRETRVSGSQSGTVSRDTWFSTTDGMVLRLELEGRTEGLATHVETIRLRLRSLVPDT